MQNKWDKEQLEIQRYLGRTNVLGKSLQKGRKIKKSQFHVQKDYIFSQLEIVYLLMWPALVNLIMGLGVWQMFCGKTGLNGDHVNGTDIWAKTEHLWGGFMAVHHEFVVSRQTYLIPWWWGGGLPFHASVVAGDWELLWCKGEWHVLIWHRSRSIIYTDYWVVLSNPILCLGPVYLSGITGIKIISEQMLAF